MTDPQRFVSKIWALQPEAPYGFVSKKNWDTGEWEDCPLRITRGIPPLPQGPDLYFCPNLFLAKHRQKNYMQKSRWLYADLDEVDPSTVGDVPPTLAWETSPNRFQALWLLDRAVPLRRFEDLNQRLTYHIGADKGGWHGTKVLRVPGSISTKYGKSRAKRFTVALVGRGGKYRLQEIDRLVPALEKQTRSKQAVFDLRNLPDRTAVLGKWRARLPIRARKLLSTKTVLRSEDRSARLWELYNLCLQAGMSPQEVLVAVKGSAWNKYAGQRRELAQLTTEIGKAAEKHADDSERERLRTQQTPRPPKPNHRSNGAVAVKVAKRAEKEADVLPYLTNSEFLAQSFPDPEWLVEGVWSKNAYGIWAGEFKAYKTVTLLDFAVSVASGVPFLGRFNVRAPGGVLYLHEEGQRGLIRDRLHRIEYNKGLSAGVNKKKSGEVELIAPPNLDHLHISSFPGFKITDEKSQHRLESYCAAKQPRLLIMESWYLIASDVNEDKAPEVAPALEYLTQVAHTYETAIIISHHYNKGSEDPAHKRRSGARVSGSGVFGRWFESAVFIERIGEEDDYAARLEAQHREQKGSGRLDLQFEMDVEDENAYTVTVIDKMQTNVAINDPKEAGGVEVDLSKTKPKTKKELGV